MKQIENVKITEFALRHFDADFGGTKILDSDSIEVERVLNEGIKRFYSDRPIAITSVKEYKVEAIHDGYAPFCKLVALENFTNAKVGSLPLDYINLANYQYVRHGFSARRKEEFETFSRWIELPVPAPKANYLMFVLYSKEQIDKEELAMYNRKIAEGGIDSIGLEKPEPFDGEWGVVAILGQIGSEEEPMKPATFERNYMPIEFGGSGMKYPVMPAKPNVPEQSEVMSKYKEELAKYRSEMDEIKRQHQRCVDFWKNHVTVK